MVRESHAVRLGLFSETSPAVGESHGLSVIASCTQAELASNDSLAVLVGPPMAQWSALTVRGISVRRTVPSWEVSAFGPLILALSHPWEVRPIFVSFGCLRPTSGLSTV